VTFQEEELHHHQSKKLACQQMTEKVKYKFQQLKKMIVQDFTAKIDFAYQQYENDVSAVLYQLILSHIVKIITVPVFVPK